MAPVVPVLGVPGLGTGLDLPKGSLPPGLAGLTLLTDELPPVVLVLTGVTEGLLAGTLVLDSLLVEVVAGGTVEVLLLLVLPGVLVWGTVGIGVGFLSGWSLFSFGCFLAFPPRILT